MCFLVEANGNQQKTVHFPVEVNSWKPAESEQTCINQQIKTVRFLETEKHSFRKKAA